VLSKSTGVTLPLHMCSADFIGMVFGRMLLITSFVQIIDFHPLFWIRDLLR